MKTDNFYNTKNYWSVESTGKGSFRL